MKRLQLLEIHDQPWCPCAIRDALTDYLQFTIVATKPYAPVAPLLAEALRRSGATRILDLCSGGTGPWLWLLPVLQAQGLNVSVCLTDRYPNLSAFARARRDSSGTIVGHPEPVDAMSVPAELTGFRTLFTSFHHFRPAQARAILADACHQRQGIGVFEATQRTPLALLSMLLVPLVVLLCTPFIRPFRWSRLLWTYLVPVVPVLVLFDGVVSCLRVYEADELNELTAGLEAEGYEWIIGTARGPGTPVAVTYAMGVPTNSPV
jgi:hypothetical protein